MKVDLAVGSLDPLEAARVARAAERLGFDGLWVAETDHDPFAAIALAAAATDRIELGTAVAIAFARSPTVLAQTAFDLARLSGGRFRLGLGTQVRGHVERRFGMVWSAPVPRLREWIGAIRAAWATWQDGAPFRYEGEILHLSLMTPLFSPPPLPADALARAGAADGAHAVPISIAGVGAGLARLAGAVAEGFHVHPLHSAAYLDQVILPAIAAGERSAGRPSGSVGRIVPVLVADVDDPAAVERVRRQVAFYAATPTYRPVLELHGAARVGERLSRLAATVRWDEMAGLVDDALLEEIAVLARRDEIATRVAARVAGRAERVALAVPFAVAADGSVADEAWWRAAIATLRGWPRSTVRSQRH